LVSRTASSIAKPRLLVLLEHRATGQQLRVRNDTKVALLARLTPSEKELVEHVCHGLSNRELAETLCKSILTVKTQLSSIFQKLGVPNRSRLISLLK
jgi:DNA-binding CsgD family transcriptional regulator